MRWMIALTAVVTGLLPAAPVHAAGDPQAAPAVAGQPAIDTAAVDRFIDREMSRHGIPGLSLALIDHGRVVFARGYGQAGAERPMSADVPMPIGSISKSLTAVTVVQLAERGEIALDAPVRSYLPEFRVADDRASRTITVRQLLQHTSGLADTGYNRVLAPGRSLEEGVRDLRHARPTTAPGTKWQYFNPNHWVLALLIERVSGRSWADAVRTGVLAPLDMTASTADLPAARPVMAQGHVKLFGFAVAEDQPYRRYANGADNVVATSPDLAAFAIAVGLPAAGRPAILSSAGLRAMRTPPPLPGDGYGLGWEVGRYQGERVEGHEGDDATYSSQMYVLPDRDRGYVLLMNQDHLVDSLIAGAQLQQGLLALLTGRAPAVGGWSMRWLGAGLLLVVLVCLVLVARSLLHLRGWTQRARTMSPARLAGAIAPHLLIPVLVWWALYRAGPALLGGRTFNIAEIGRYLVPDVLLLLGLLVIPNLLQGLYMLVTAVLARRGPSPRRSGSAARHRWEESRGAQPVGRG